MVATLWGEHQVVGTRSQLPPPLADLDDDGDDDDDLDDDDEI